MPPFAAQPPPMAPPPTFVPQSSVASHPMPETAVEEVVVAPPKDGIMWPDMLASPVRVGRRHPRFPLSHVFFAGRKTGKANPLSLHVSDSGSA